MSVVENGQDTRELVLTRLREDTSFVLATHENPDGDALGSLVAMQGLLTTLGKHSEMFISPADLPLPREYRAFPLDGLIQQPPPDIASRTVVFLDCGNIDRNSASVLRNGAHLLNIDHHHDNTRFGTLNLVQPQASCTAEIVWDLMGGLDVSPSPAIAEALYIGLITDTGRFMYENTTPRSHRMAAELIEAGVAVPLVYRRLYEDMPTGKLTLLALALARLQRFDEGKLTIATLSAADFQSAEAEDSYSEGIIDQLRALQGTKVAALVRELSAGSARASTKSRCAPPTTTSTCRRSPAPRVAAGTAARPVSRPRWARRTCWPSCARRSPPSCSRTPTVVPRRRRPEPLPRRRAQKMDGVLLIDKPAGISSHTAVAAVRRALDGVKTGHAGTLDPFATGLLLILIGRATKSQRALMGLPKSYETVAQLGATSTTGDPEGDIEWTGRIPPDPPELPTGEVRQRPPIYSAIKVGGERAYRRARRGESFQMPERIVTVTRFQQLWRTADAAPGEGVRAAFAIDCGSGTYVRSLIEQLQDAYCLTLRRTAIGPFDVRDAIAPPARGGAWEGPPAGPAFIELERALELARH